MKYIITVIPGIDATLYRRSENSRTYAPQYTKVVTGKVAEIVALAEELNGKEQGPVPALHTPEEMAAVLAKLNKERKIRASGIGGVYPDEAMRGEKPTVMKPALPDLPGAKPAGGVIPASTWDNAKTIAGPGCELNNASYFRPEPGEAVTVDQLHRFLAPLPAAARVYWDRNEDGSGYIRVEGVTL